MLPDTECLLIIVGGGDNSVQLSPPLVKAGKDTRFQIGLDLIVHSPNQVEGLLKTDDHAGTHDTDIIN